MEHDEYSQVDYGTGQKKLTIYIKGFIACVILTICAFASVMSGKFSNREMFVIIYSAAVLQFFIQVIYFLRLNTQTEQGRINVMSIIFTAVILTSILVGSLWIMYNLNYNMAH